MKYSYVLVFLISLFYFNVNGQSPENIMQKSIDAVSFEGFEMTSVLKIYDQKGNLRQRTIETSGREFGDISKTVSRFLAPPEVRGTSVLIHDHSQKSTDMWIFLPATQKVRRVAAAERKAGFMGSEFTNGNMSKPDLSEYNIRLIGSANLSGKECYKIELNGKNEGITRMDGFARQVSWIEKNTHLNLQTNYFDAKGKLLKTQVFSEFKKLPNGKYFCYKMEMFNEVNGRRSVLETKSFELGSARKETAFAPNTFMN